MKRLVAVVVVKAMGTTFAKKPAGGLLPTNDAFAGLNAVTLPTADGTYVFYVPAYDAGTEANDE